MTTMLNRLWQLTAFTLALPIMVVSATTRGISLVTWDTGVWLLEQFKDEDWS